MHKFTYYDANMFLGDWPFHRLKHNTVEGILYLMNSVNISKGIVSSLDSIFCIDRDITIVNQRLYDTVKDYPKQLLPFYTIHPNIVDSCDYVEELVNSYNLHGIRLYPTYHDYSLQSHGVDELAQKARELSVPIHITYRFEDDRVHHPKAKVPALDDEELTNFLNKHPGTKFIIGGARITEIDGMFNNLTNDNVFVELSFIQTPFRSLELLAKTIGADKIIFGTGLPYWYPECTTLKVETSILDTEDLQKISRYNLENLLSEKVR